MEHAVEYSLATISILLWGDIVWRFATGRWTLKPRPYATVPWDTVEVLFAITVYVIASVIGMQVAASLVHIENGAAISDLTASQMAAMQAADSIAKILFLTITIGMLVMRCRATMRDLGIDSSHALGDLLRGLLAFFLIVPTVLWFKWLLTRWIDFPAHSIERLLLEPGSGRLLAIAAFSAVIVAPLFEEFVFRLLLQGWFEKLVQMVRSQYFNVDPIHAHAPETDDPEEPKDEIPESAGGAGGRCDLLWRGVPVIGSSLLFALMHSGPDRIPLFLLALGLGYLFQYTGRLLPCIVVHFMLNGLSVATIFVSRGS